MIFHATAYSAGGERQALVWPIVVSIVGHLILFGLVLYSPKPSANGALYPSVIDVQMVDMPGGTPAAAPKKMTEAEKAPETAKPVEKVEPEVQADPKQQPEVSIAPPQPKAKTALKYKTFKSQEVLKNALEKLEKKVDTAPSKTLQDTIKRLREQVDKEGRPETSGVDAGQGVGDGKKGGFAAGGQQEAEAIDIYRLEVAFTINKNWAFAEQLAGDSGNLMALIVFKVMPDGAIEDIFFTDRSGNAYLDDSAYKAIVKSSPVKPHPEGMNRKYIEMGLRFTPKGVR